MNLLLCDDAQPSQLILCTYTEKAAREMQDLLMKVARDVEYQQDLASLRIGTIHSICKQLITENNHYLPIENDFITLDEFTRQLLIFEEIDKICTPNMKRFFRKRWGSLWQMAKELGSSFDKITEELLFEKLKEKYDHVAIASLQTDNDRLCAYLTHAYSTYQKILAQRNCLDFAHLQKCAYKLLRDPKTLPYLAKGIQYVLVDEYQDTNYIQEQILTLLASATRSNNLFVVGDEDQALYRFRGATVRNILEFKQTFPDCKEIRLMTAMSYFDHDEVRLMLACFARILDFEKEPAEINEDDSFPYYLDKCREQLKKALPSHVHLQSMLFHMREEITHQEQRPETQEKPLLDYFYRLVTVNPFLLSFKGTGNQTVQPHHLEVVSDLLQTFQRYYRYTGVTHQNRSNIADDFFQKFLPLLYSNGWNNDEASSQAFPKGHVPILTIHQAKGLEFPVVVGGRLDKIFASSDSQKHKALQEFSHRPPFEPDACTPNFDLRRLYYVAFSRAKKLLVLMAVRKPGNPLASLWQDLPSWPHVALKNMPESEPWEKPSVPRPRYGLTNDMQLYMTCPRQFQFFRTYNFTPSHNRAYFSGQLVHHTLEHIHRMARDRKLEDLNEEALSKIFERKFQALTQAYLSSIDSEQKTRAWQQIMRYLQQNWETLDRVDAAELSVQVDKPEYILTGTIDLLVKTAGGVDLIDFKTLRRPGKNAVFLEQYEQQLHFYAHAVEQSHGQRPERLFLYWIAEERKENALMEIPYQAGMMKKMSANLESVAENIKNKHFHVRKPPAVEVCQRCDIRHLCRQDRVIEI